MSRYLYLFLALLGLFLTSACLPFVGNMDLDIQTSTPESLPSPTMDASTPLPEPTPLPASAGTVTGRVCYPGEFIPAMTAYFQQTPSGLLTELPIAEGQLTYTLELAPGIYRAFTWSEKYQIASAYTGYAACGYGNTCPDHTLLSFEVLAGQTLTDIDLCDGPYPADQLPLPRPVSENDPALNGLTYSLPEGPLYRIDAYGYSKPLNSALGVVISPDGNSGLYPFNGDLYVMSLAGGEPLNLTNTPNIIEILYQWPLQDRIFFTALTAGLGERSSMTGGLYSIRPDGSALTALDPDTNVGNFAISPDGHFAAYGGGQTGYLYDLQLNQRGVFDPTTFGINSESGLYLTSPAWAPDSQKLAWLVQGNFMGPGVFAVVVFDLFTNTTEIIHPYHIVGMDGLLPPAKFSPDGNWIAFTAFDEDPTQYGVWVASVGDPNQSTQFFMGSYSNTPYWSPDGRWLAYQQYAEAEQVNKVFVYDLTLNVILQAVQLPPNASIIGW
ncbi:MAG: PD40 domain-containing protein [Anaerolineales bacterium]|nr:PD40 domain-containing protein [Anaerolineales bacterium]